MGGLYAWVDGSRLTGPVFDAWLRSIAANGPDWVPWGMHMMWGSWGIGMMLMMVLFWAVIIVGIIFLIRWLVSAGNVRQPMITERGTESALEILKKRYARGEISKQEFDDMRQDIQ